MTRVEHIGDATLYLGDCREVLPGLSGVDAVVTDPPYGIEGTWSGGNSHGWGRFKGQAKAWDQRPDWLHELVALLPVPTIIWGGNYFALPQSGSWLFWDKLVREFTSGHGELAWTNLGKPVRAFNFSHGQLATEGKEHPTQKPLSLMAWCITLLPATCVVVLDPFAGSGTTGVACAKLGRSFVGCEVHEPYFDIMCRRIEAAQRQGDLLRDIQPRPKMETGDLLAGIPA